MKGPKSIYFGILILVLALGILWYTSRNKNDSDTDNTSSTKISMDQTPIEKNIKQQPKTANTEEEIVNFVDTTEKQKEFTKKITELNTLTLGCQKDVENLFPLQTLDDPSKKYKSAEEFKNALNKFYSIVGKKIEKSADLVNFLETVPEAELPSDRLFNQLSTVEDCGDFEEEAILDQAMTTAEELGWPMDQKKELTSAILQNFKQQLNMPIGFHQLSTKFEIVKSLVEDGFLPAKFSQEMAAMEQAIDAAENEFRLSLPADLAEKKPSLRDIVDIKNGEKDITEKLKPQLNDIISNYESGL